jgi:hypothetical protein
LPPLIHKLWDRGIDIGVGVVTSVIVAIIGYIFWRVKLGLDLHAEEKKQRQQHRIAEELSREKDMRDLHERRAKLKHEMEGYAAVAERTTELNSLTELWDHFRRWLQGNDLLSIQSNRESFHANARGGPLANISMGTDMLAVAVEIAKIIRQTQLPKQ